MGSRGMDPSRVTFNPAAIARHSNKVEVDSRYRAEVNVVTRKKRPALDDLLTGIKESPDKKETKPTYSTKTTKALSTQKRAFTEVSNNSEKIFTLPSFKKQKTASPDPKDSRNGTTKPINQKPTTTVTTKPTTTNRSTPSITNKLSTPITSKPTAPITSKPSTPITNKSISLSSSSTTTTTTTTTAKSPSTTNTLITPAQAKLLADSKSLSTSTSKSSSSSSSSSIRPASNGLVSKPSYASVTSKPSLSSSNKPLTNGSKASSTTGINNNKGIGANKQVGSGAKPAPSGSKPIVGSKPQAPGSKSLTSKSPPTSSLSKPHAKSAPAQLPKSYVTSNPVSRSGFVNSHPSTVKPGQVPRNTTLQTLPNRPTGPPGSKLPLQNGKQKPRHVEHNEYEYDPIADREELGEEENYWNNNYSSVIQDLFRRKHKYPPMRHNNDIDEDVRETGFLDWEAEEEISEAAGEREDRAEFISEKKRKLAKQKRRMPDL